MTTPTRAEPSLEQEQGILLAQEPETLNPIPSTTPPPIVPPLSSPYPHRRSDTMQDNTPRSCQWHRLLPPDERPRGSDSGTMAKAGRGWRCRHAPRPGSDLCTSHELAHERYTMILEWGVYQMSRRRESWRGHAYDWACRKDVSGLTLSALSAALDLIVADRARDGAKRSVVEVSDLVRAIASVQRDTRREVRSATCGVCFGSGWRTVWDADQPAISGAIACDCNHGRARASEAVERGRQVHTVHTLPHRWTTAPPVLA